MRIENDYLRITNQQEAAVFLEEEIETPDGPARLTDISLRIGKPAIYHYAIDEHDWCWAFVFRVSKAVVKKVCTAEEGKPGFNLTEIGEAAVFPMYRMFDGERSAPSIWLKANALTIGKTVGELRALIAWWSE